MAAVAGSSPEAKDRMKAFLNGPRRKVGDDGASNAARAAAARPRRPTAPGSAHFQRWLATERDLAFADLRRAARVVGDGPRGLLVGDLAVLRGAVRDAAGAGARPTRDAGTRSGSPAPRSTTPSTAVGRPEDADNVAVIAYSQTRRPVELTFARTARSRCAGSRAGLRRLGVGRGDRVVGVPAERPRDAGRLPRHREPRRHLGQLRPRVRRAQRGRPVRPDRTDGDVRRRGLQLRRQGRRPPRRGRRDPRRLPSLQPRRAGAVRAEHAARRARAGASCCAEPGAARPSSRCRSTTRCTCCSPPAPPGSRRRSCTATAGSCSST